MITKILKRITQIYMIFQGILYLCNQFLIGVIRDFWAFSEISEDLIIPLPIRFSQSYRLFPSAPQNLAHKNIAQRYGGRRSTWIPLGPVF
jgi:hypothetical protein